MGIRDIFRDKNFNMRVTYSSDGGWMAFSAYFANIGFALSSNYVPNMISSMKITFKYSYIDYLNKSLIALHS